jgi:UrcA family protein
MKHDTSARFALFAKIGKYTLIGASATLITLAGLAPALSAAPGAVPSVTVRYDASAANTDAGALELYGRLQFAARRVCPTDEGQPLQLVVRSRQCQQEALSRAVSQIHNRRLVEIAAARADRG